ncbi:MAG TPA: hypothetical protein VFP68_10790 [Burkholderiaceae bacterium]|nr:hypothetical protein [Burkholderiaceae bacterium]
MHRSWNRLHPADAGRLPSWSRPAALIVAACALLAVVNLVLGIAGGLARFGAPGPRGPALALHGLLLVSGFFGTLVALERFIAVGRTAWLLAPVASAVGGLMAWSGAPVQAALIAWLVAGFALMSGCVFEAARGSMRLPLLLRILGAACWSVGNLLWLQGALAHLALPGWLAFLVLTIVSEREDVLSSLRTRPLAAVAFGAAIVLLPLSMLVAGLEATLGLPIPAPSEVPALIQWTGCLLLALVLLSGKTPQPRDGGWAGWESRATRAADAWLLVASLLGLSRHWLPFAAGGPAWHALLLGFAFSTLFAHVPRLLMSMSKEPLRYTAWFAFPLVLLSASLALRVTAAGFQHPLALLTAGVGHAIAIAAYALLITRAVVGRG